MNEYVARYGTVALIGFLLGCLVAAVVAAFVMFIPWTVALLGGVIGASTLVVIEATTDE